MSYKSSSFLPLFDGLTEDTYDIQPATEYSGFSLLQPWATLFAAGMKKFETRSWGINIKGKLIIQASAGFSSVARKLCETEYFSEALHLLGYKSWRDLPRSALVGSVVIKRTYSTEEMLPKIDMRELAFGDYSPGRRAWLAEKPVLYKTPIPCKGAQSIWKMPRELYPLIEAEESVQISRPKT